MEIASVAEVRPRQEQPARTAPPRAQQALPQKGDQLELSPEAKKRLEEQKRQQQAADTTKVLREEFEQADKRAKAQAEALSIAGKCMTIAGRIMAGDRVPPKDERYLAQNDKELYMMAIMMRRQKENPQKYRSITDSDQSTEKPVTVTSGETASLEPPTGGGEGSEGGEPPAE